MVGNRDGNIIVNSRKSPSGKAVQAITVKCTLSKRWSHNRYSSGFRCTRSDATIQEADLAKDLVMDGKLMEV